MARETPPLAFGTPEEWHRCRSPTRSPVGLSPTARPILSVSRPRLAERQNRSVRGSRSGYLDVSISKYPSSPKLNTVSIICWVKSYRPSTSFVTASLSAASLALPCWALVKVPEQMRDKHSPAAGIQRYVIASLSKSDGSANYRARWKPSRYACCSLSNSGALSAIHILRACGGTAEYRRTRLGQAAMAQLSDAEGCRRSHGRSRKRPP